MVMIIGVVLLLALLGLSIWWYMSSRGNDDKINIVPPSEKEGLSTTEQPDTSTYFEGYDEETNVSYK